MSNPNSASTSIRARINDEMHAILDRYLPNRRPVSLEDYDWSQIKPETVDQDLMGAVGLVTLVESNPAAPGEKILAAADRSDAPWLRRFITQTWLPEEGMHHVPFKEYLIRAGIHEKSFLDSEIAKVIERGFVHGEGYTEVKAATYGWLQELITWRFYGSMHSYLLSNSTKENPADPVLLKILSDIAKQENFHRHIYLSGVKTVLKYAPERKGEVIKATAEFLMPGHHMAPEWQSKAPQWSVKFNFRVRSLLHDVTRGLVELTGYKGLGQATIMYGSSHTIHWYLKPLVMLLNPLSLPYSSPLNYLAGRFLAKVT